MARIRPPIMTDHDTTDAEAPAAPALPTPSLEDMQHWTWVMGRAQQLMMEHLAAQMGEAVKAAPDPEAAVEKAATSWPGMNMFADPAKIMQMQSELWTEGLSIWQRALGTYSERTALEEKADKDRRFSAKAWQDNPLYDTIRQTYL